MQRQYTEYKPSLDPLTEEETPLLETKEEKIPLLQITQNDYGSHSHQVSKKNTSKLHNFLPEITKKAENEQTELRSKKLKRNLLFTSITGITTGVGICAWKSYQHIHNAYNTSSYQLFSNLYNQYKTTLSTLPNKTCNDFFEISSDGYTFAEQCDPDYPSLSKDFNRAFIKFEKVCFALYASICDVVQEMSDDSGLEIMVLGFLLIACSAALGFGAIRYVDISSTYTNAANQMSATPFNEFLRAKTHPESNIYPFFKRGINDDILNHIASFLVKEPKNEEEKVEFVIRQP